MRGVQAQVAVQAGQRGGVVAVERRHAGRRPARLIRWHLHTGTRISANLVKHMHLHEVCSQAGQPGWCLTVCLPCPRRFRLCCRSPDFCTTHAGATLQVCNLLFASWQG